MADVRRLLNALSAQESQLRGAPFLAPCVRGGRVRTRMAGLVCTFAPRPASFEGWGIFQPVDAARAEVLEEASLPRVAEYPRLLTPLRMRLAHALQGQTWLAYPVNESDARQRWGRARPAAVHLVSEGARFEQVLARWDGSAWWFEEVDRRADPRVAERLRDALRAVTPPEALRFKGITPEMRTAYDLAAQQAQQFRAMIQQRRDEQRLRSALRLSGGGLRDVAVTVCGAGALGANIAESLARSGFDRLTVIDRDRVEERNLSTAIIRWRATSSCSPSRSPARRWSPSPRRASRAASP